MQMFLSSADFMTRNLNRRVEVACPVYDSVIRGQVMDILQCMLHDNSKARNLRYDGLYEKKGIGQERIDCQKQLIEQALLGLPPAQSKLPEKAVTEKKGLAARIKSFLFN